MTPELRAAAERVRRVHAGATLDAVYGRSLNDIGQHAFFTADRLTLAEAYLAEHPADDGEPVTLDWVRKQTDMPCGVRFGVPFVRVGEQRVIIKTREQLRYLLKGLGR